MLLFSQSFHLISLAFFFHFVRWSFEWSFSARFKSNYTRLLTQLDWSSRNGKRYGTRTSVTWNAHYTYTLFDWFSACLFFGFPTYTIIKCCIIFYDHFIILFFCVVCICLIFCYRPTIHHIIDANWMCDGNGPLTFHHQSDMLSLWSVQIGPIIPLATTNLNDGQRLK